MARLPSSESSGARNVIRNHPRRTRQRLQRQLTISFRLPWLRRHLQACVVAGGIKNYKNNKIRLL